LDKQELGLEEGGKGMCKKSFGMTRFAKHPDDRQVMGVDLGVLGSCELGGGEGFPWMRLGLWSCLVKWMHATLMQC